MTVGDAPETKRLGRCGECGAHPWIEGDAPPCDDSECTFPYWEPIYTTARAEEITPMVTVREPRADLTPASAARLLLESPEAVERMARGMWETSIAPPIAAALMCKVPWEAASEHTKERQRHMASAALRSIAGEEG